MGRWLCHEQCCSRLLARSRLPIGRFLGCNGSFSNEKRALYVYVIDNVAVTPSDRRRGAARSDVFSNPTLRPSCPRFLFAASLPKTCGILPTPRLLIRSPSATACHPNPGTTTAILSIFRFLVSTFRDRTVSAFGSGPPSFASVTPSSRFSPFPLPGFSRLVGSLVY